MIFQARLDIIKLFFFVKQNWFQNLRITLTILKYTSVCNSYNLVIDTNKNVLLLGNNGYEINLILKDNSILNKESLYLTCCQFR